MAGIDIDLDSGGGNLLAADLGDALLMYRIDVAENRHDADRVDLVADQRTGGGGYLVLVEREHDIAEMVDAFGDAMGAAARHQGIGVGVSDRMEPVGIGIVRPGLQTTAHQHHVLHAFGGDQTKLATGTREQGVEHTGTGIEHHVETGEKTVEGDTPSVRGIGSGRNEAFGLVFRRGRGFADLEVPVLIDKDGVGHRAARVDADHDWVFQGLTSMALLMEEA